MDKERVEFKAAAESALASIRNGVIHVTIDKSLRRKGRLRRSRNVLKRAERITRLEFEDRWEEGQSPFGLPKVRVIKTVVGKKKKKKAKEEADEKKKEDEGQAG